MTIVAAPPRAAMSFGRRIGADRDGGATVASCVILRCAGWAGLGWARLMCLPLTPSSPSPPSPSVATLGLGLGFGDLKSKAESHSPSTLLISLAPKPVCVRLCLGREMPAGPTAPWMSTIGAPMEGRRSRVGSCSGVFDIAMVKRGVWCVSVCIAGYE